MVISMDQNLNVQVLLGGVTSIGDTLITQKEVAISEGDISFDGSGNMSGETSGEMYGNMTGTTTKDPLLSGYPFVIGISSITLIVSIGLGILLAKRKIKKGFELYED